MNVSTSLPVIVTLVVALLVSWLIAALQPSPSGNHRFAAIDGLRGYLAFAVFIHHAASWQSYLNTGLWRTRPGTIYIQMGVVPVEMFFMITAFLFTNKVLVSRETGARPVDWTKFVVGRFLRIAPLFYVVLSLVFAIVAVQSHGVQSVSVFELLTQIATWTTFTVFSQPNINGITSWIITAGVMWTLPYEILFYMALPLFAALVGRPPSWRLMIASALMAGATALAIEPDLRFMAAFAAGSLAAVLVRSSHFNTVARSRVASVVIVLSVAVVLSLFETPLDKYSLLLLSMVFALIAGGNTVFGILSHRSSRLFGEMAYSIYLIHGLLLYLFFTIVSKLAPELRLTPFQFWLCIVALVPVLLVIAFTSFKHVELPPMRRVGAVSRWIDGERKLRNDSIESVPRSSVAG